ncbi:Na+/H+ antiporter subunit E [Rhodopila sp.]|jgi:multicomponent Na+:H+ antiporter subunit E|uniref:Na+/H+ antiporter subunit E n=1 Tax=Rhodopila sp. TaxID=2480087 RepID=UPI002CE612BE|nr:Na+/H+ antiporter subunit E [Rhodopila sp.]HVZ08592.1 Na+/H+ antiporter subunit E [Rhodopila sp.]
MIAAIEVLLRGVLFLILWLVLAGAHLADLPAAAAAAVLAAWASMVLSPPAEGVLSLPDLLRMVLRFPPQSLAAGIDVARRAFSPAMPLRVDVVPFAPRLPPGPARDAFLAYASTMPGTVPVVTGDDGAVVIHCLDGAQPVGQQMADEEACFIRMLGRDDA